MLRTSAIIRGDGAARLRLLTRLRCLFPSCTTTTSGNHRPATLNATIHSSFNTPMTTTMITTTTTGGASSLLLLSSSSSSSSSFPCGFFSILWWRLSEKPLFHLFIGVTDSASMCENGSYRPAAATTTTSVTRRHDNHNRIIIPSSRSRSRSRSGGGSSGMCDSRSAFVGVGGAALRRLGMCGSPRACGLALYRSAAPTLCTARRHYMPLPKDQEDFTAYAEIDLPSESRIETIRKAGLANQEWVACEKVHGANFGIYLLREQEVRFAKRSGIMDPNENFFGYHVLQDQFTAQIHIMCDLLKQKYGLGRIERVILNGEIFGARYEHPLVPKSTKWCVLPNGKKVPIAGIEIQREPFPQYSPELQFFAFDMKYSVSGAEEDLVVLDFDEFSEIAEKIPNLLYSKPIVRGTLDDCLAFDVENFYTPLPALLGLGNYPLEGNLAEGVVIRHVKRGHPQIERHNVSTIIKLRCSSFMELKHPGKQKELKETFIDTVRAGALKRTKGGATVLAKSMLPQLEAAACDLLLNNVSDGRLSNVLSKVGREPLLAGALTKTQVGEMLAKDALKDFLKEGDELILNTPIVFRRKLVETVYLAAQDLVSSKWDEVMKEEKAKQKKQEAEAAAAAGSSATA